MSPKRKSLVEIAKETHRDLNLVPSPALSQREIVERVLCLANESVTDQQKEAAQFVSMLSHGFSKAEIEKLAKLHGSDFLRRVWNGFSADRERFHDQIELVHEDRTRARKILRDQIAADLDDVVPIPEITFSEDWKVVTETRYFALSLQGACAFALALLLDESTGLGTALRKCKLEPLCSNFFLSLPSPKGGRPPQYCCRAHQEMYAAQTGAERMERYRQNKAKKRRN